MEPNLRGLFEQALDAETEPPPGELAAAAMAQGMRLRRRRRVLVAGSAVVAALVAVPITNLVVPARPAVTQVMDPTPLGWQCSGSTVGGRTVTLLLRTDTTDAQRSALNGALTSDRSVHSLRFESREQAYQRFKVIWRDSPDIATSVGPEPLAESFRITLSDPAAATQLVDEFRDRPGVRAILPGDCSQTVPQGPTR
jgi:hypothetical protein